MPGDRAAAASLQAKIEGRSARLCVIGLGYVGLPLALEFAKAGFTVTGLDTDRARIRRLRNGESYIGDIASEDVRAAVQGGWFLPSARDDVLGEADAVCICVPTPLGRGHAPDLRSVRTAAEKIRRHLRSGQLIVLESTTYPGTTEELVLPALASRGLRVGVEFFLAFSPERIDPGNKRFRTRNIPRVVGGVTPTCTKIAMALYGQLVESVVSVSSPRAAEMVKLLENTFRAVNIGLVNEFAVMSHRLGVNVWEVIRAATTKPFGFMPFSPGPGLGGHCIAVDPHYLAWKVRQLRYAPRFIELASRVNAEMPRFVLSLVERLLRQQGRRLAGSRVLILGVTYKKDVADTRESPALALIRLLRPRGVRVAYHDPYIPRVSLGRTAMRSITLGPAYRRLRAFDGVVIATDHSCLNYRQVLQQSRGIVDTRNVLSDMPEAEGKVVRL